MITFLLSVVAVHSALRIAQIIAEELEIYRHKILAREANEEQKIADEQFWKLTWED